MRETPARRATSDSVVRRTPTSSTQARAASRTAPSSSRATTPDLLRLDVTCHSVTVKPRRRDMLWSGWGDPGKAVTLPPAVLTLLEQALGVQPADRAPVPIAQVRLPDAALDPAVATELAMFVGPPNLHTHHDARVKHAAGRSTADLLRLRA